MEGGRRRITLYDQMLAVGDGGDLTGKLTLNDILTIHQRSSPSPTPAVRLTSRTLLDIIRDDAGKSPAGNRDTTSWRFLRDRLRLNLRSQISPPISLRFAAFPTAEMSPDDDHSPESPTPAPSIRQISRRSSTRFNHHAPPCFDAENPDGSPTGNNSGAAGSGGSQSLLRPQMSRRKSKRFSLGRSESFEDLTDPAREGRRRLSAALAEEGSVAVREAVVAQEAADEGGEEAEGSSTAEETAAPVRMSLMDLLEETDRQMGIEGSRYRIEEEEVAEKDVEEEVAAVHGGGRGGGAGDTCCVCMMRHKGAAFIPCGHTFCRHCSKELLVNRGNCPLCNGYILEILDIF